MLNIALLLLIFLPSLTSAQSLRKLPPESHNEVFECSGHVDSEDSEEPLPLYTVEVVVKNRIRGYRVSATWHPSQVYHGVSGPAIVELVQASNGRTHVFTTNYFSLPESIVPKDCLTDSGTVDRSIDGRQIEISYPIMVEGYGAGGMEASNLPFYFRDVDFDGKDEILFVYAGGGQRSYSVSHAYSLSCHCPHDMIDYHHMLEGPAAVFDDLATFDMKSMTLTKASSNGACANSYTTYKWSEVPTIYEASSQRELMPEKVVAYEMGDDGKCYEVTYSYTRSRLREVSRFEWK